jgi:hypothetical protein
MSHLERIQRMTPDEHRAALCFLAGYNPFVLEQALNEMDRQRTMFAAHRLIGTGLTITPTPAEQQWLEIESTR